MTEASYRLRQAGLLAVAAVMAGALLYAATGETAADRAREARHAEELREEADSRAVYAELLLRDAARCQDVGTDAARILIELAREATDKETWQTLVTELSEAAWRCPRPLDEASLDAEIEQLLAST